MRYGKVCARFQVTQYQLAGLRSKLNCAIPQALRVMET
jgi:hypothetical protein